MHAQIASTSESATVPTSILLVTGIAAHDATREMTPPDDPPPMETEEAISEEDME